MNFNVGDRVICIKPDGYLMQDQQYTVKRIIQEKFLVLEPHNDGGWLTKRFVLLSPASTKSFLVEAVDKNDLRTLNTLMKVIKNA